MNMIRITTLFIFFITFGTENLNAEQYLFSFFQNNKENKVDYKFLETVIGKVQKEYVKEVPEQKLVENALRGVLVSLDPNSDFLNSDEYKEIKTITRGEFGGLAIEVIMEQGVLRVISPYEDGPGFKAGIRAGDYIVMIDDTLVNGLSMSEALEKLKGAPGTKVKLKVHRENGETKNITVKREVVKLLPAKVQYLAKDEVAYVKIGNFNEKTAGIVGSDLQSLLKKHPSVKGVILDLRGNPGGLFEQATEIADLFLKEGRIVSIRGRNKDMHIYEAREEDIADNLPMVVLINGGSASASEIVAGALQDNKRAVIIGTKSFGKGSVQSVIPFDNGTAIKLTTAYFYTPSGKSIQNEGILPDIDVPEDMILVNEQKVEDLSDITAKKKYKTRRNTIGSLNKDEDIITDYQLQRAIDFIKGMSLYSNIKEKK